MPKSLQPRTNHECHDWSELLHFHFLRHSFCKHLKVCVGAPQKKSAAMILHQASKGKGHQEIGSISKAADQQSLPHQQDAISSREAAARAVYSH